jgi:hypothetical protein
VRLALPPLLLPPLLQPVHSSRGQPVLQLPHPLALLHLLLVLLPRLPLPLVAVLVAAPVASQAGVQRWMRTRGRLSSTTQARRQQGLMRLLLLAALLLAALLALLLRQLMAS